MAVYTAGIYNVTIVGNATLLIVSTAAALSSSGSVLRVMRAGVSQIGTETSDQLGMTLGTKVAAFGTYTAVTPASHNPGGVASAIVGGTSGAAGTAGGNASAEGAGAVTPIVTEGFNNVGGWLYVPTPEERLLVPPSTALVLKLTGTPTTLTGWCAYITYREID